MANNIRENKFFFYVSLFAGKACKLALRLLNKRVYYYPGTIAGKICPNIKHYINKPKTIIAVTGTNGKSTTCKMLLDFLSSQGLKVISNDGFNTSPGIIATLLNSITITNKQLYDVAILEVDELTSKRIFKDLKIDYLIITNLFRDSIEKNGTPEFMASRIKEAIQDDSKLIINADDALTTTLSNDNTVFYGMANLDSDHDKPYNIMSDLVLCPKCNEPLNYSHIKYSHIGKYKCKCGYCRPKCKYELTQINFKKNYFVFNGNKYNLNFTNIHNTYNAIGVFALLFEMGYDYQTINSEFQNIKILSTRHVSEEKDGKILTSILAKGQNPAAVSQTFETINKNKNDKTVILLMDDVSTIKRNECEVEEWLYDSDFEFLDSKRIKKIIIGGIRAKDYYVRMLMANINPNKIRISYDERKVIDYIDYDDIDEIILVHDVFNNDLIKEIKTDIRKRWYKQ